MTRVKRLSLLAVIMIVVLMTANCAGAAPTPAAPAPTEKPAEPQAAQPTQAAPAEPAAASNEDAALIQTYGLTPGKPYEGTKLRFLICCPTATQFAALTRRTPTEFTRLTGIEVQWDDSPFSAFQEKLLTEAVAGTGDYDVVAWVDAWGHGIKPFLVPLDDRIKEAGIDMSDFPQAYVEVAKGNDGTTYGIPFRGHAQILFYRKDVLEELGLEPPATWQELIEAGKAIEAESDLEAISMYYGVNAGQNLFNWLNHLWGNGADIFDEKQCPIFNSPEGVEATQAYVDLLLKHELTAPGSVTFNEQDANLEMVQGRAAMFVGWSWMYDRFTNKETAAPDVYGNVGFAPAPGWEGGEPLTYGYIWPVGILQSSKNQDAAWEYIKWLTNVQVEREIAIDKSDPMTSNIVVVHLSNLRDPEVNATTGGLQEVMGEILETARTEPLIEEWTEVQSLLEVAINEMATGAPLEATLDRAAADVKAVMQRGGKCQE